MNVRYHNFLLGKKRIDIPEAPPIIANPHPNAKPHQSDCLKRLLAIGRGAAFLDTGLGKTFLQVDFARHMTGKTIIVAPLGVCHQTIMEAKNLLGVDISYSSDGVAEDQITITNYDRLDLFDASQFECVILDESSILKGKNSKTKGRIIEMFSDTPYRLACTATPAPNDYTEIGNHAEFLGIMNTQEMLTRWFVHDSANTADWRLKGHAVNDFWQWVSSWACCVSKPSDLGHDDTGYDLPPLTIETKIVKAPLKMADGMLFDLPDVSATALHSEKKKTLSERCQIVADEVNSNDNPWIVWCESNEESLLLKSLIPDAVEVKGSDSIDQKEERLLAFSEGRARVIVSKPSICGFGMNWQHCRNIAFASISYSYEKFYQAVRRSWRFGQTKSVNVLVVIADSELPVWRSIERKSTDHESMKSYMKLAVFKKHEGARVKIDYAPKKKTKLPDWIAS
jgi:hypothetical protein